MPAKDFAFFSNGATGATLVCGNNQTNDGGGMAAQQLPCPSQAVKRPARRTPQGTVRVLAPEFEAKGWTFEQVFRKGTVCLYRKTKGSEGGKMITSWEVVIPIVRRAQRLLDGSVCPRREVYPSNNDWGTRGWTYLTEVEATAAYAARRGSQNLGN